MSTDRLGFDYAKTIRFDSDPLILSRNSKSMDAARSPLRRIDYLLRKADYVNWHRQQSNRQILRSQQGFSDVEPSRPRACRGCANYHGVAYGYSRESRTALVCGFHPYGWLDDADCPDWQESR